MGDSITIGPLEESAAAEGRGSLVLRGPQLSPFQTRTPFRNPFQAPTDTSPFSGGGGGWGARGPRLVGGGAEADSSHCHQRAPGAHCPPPRPVQEQSGPQ